MKHKRTTRWTRRFRDRLAGFIARKAMVLASHIMGK